MSKPVAVSFVQFLYQTKVTDKNPAIHPAMETEDLAVLEKEIGLNENTLLEYKRLWTEMPQTELKHVDETWVRSLKEKDARKHRVVIFDGSDTEYSLAAENPLDDRMQTYLDIRLDKELKIFLANKDSLEDIISRIYRKTDEIIRHANMLAQPSSGVNANASEAAGVVSVRELLDLILDDAAMYGATDVHFEMSGEKFIYYFRIGHETSRKIELPTACARMIQQRIIILGQGDIAEESAPQDLNFSYKCPEKNIDIDVRVSVLNAASGFSTVLRLLKGFARIFRYDNMFTDTGSYDVGRRFLKMKSGLCLVTGPTSSGKTTLLYSMLSELGDQNKKILTAEDPVEINYPFLIQTQVEPKMGLNFSDIIRSSLRQNPDVLMIGEVRDVETCEMAVRAALTGTLTFSTLHTESASKTIARLFDLGVEPFLLGSALKLIFSVRLMRLFCSHCREEDTLPSEDKESLDQMFPEETDLNFPSYKATGCVMCDSTGMKGQAMVSEFISMDEKIRSFICNSETTKLTEHLAGIMKGREMKDNALILFRKGMIPFDELVGVSTEI